MPLPGVRPGLDHPPPRWGEGDRERDMGCDRLAGDATAAMSMGVQLRRLDVRSAGGAWEKVFGEGWAGHLV